nr:hypothetical protein [Candidatus Saccharibacteria bacterium]
MQILIKPASILKIFILAFVVMAFAFALQVSLSPKVFAGYDGGKLIDNAAFLDANSMNASQIQSFLVGKGAGIANMNFVLNCYGQESKERQWYTAVGAACDTSMPASSIIFYAAQIYGINPKIILATLQKEQSLVTAPNPTSWQINQAMGYACPTSGQCAGSSTFPYQIDSGTWVLRYHYERASGNMSWWTQSSSWTCGTAKSLYTPNLYPGQNVNFIDQDGVLYRTLYLHNAASSSMYCYTPHTYNNPQGLYGLPVYGTVGRYYTGSYNFVQYYELWFDPGSTITNNVTMNIISQPDASPARGQTVSYTISFRNNASTNIVVDAIGIVGRAGSLNGANLDFGWQGPITLAPGITQQYTFTSPIRDTGVLYVWPAVYYQGVYVQYNNWGSTIVSRAPNFTLSQPLTTSSTTIYAGQNVTFSAVLKNNEAYSISYDALGIPVKFYDRYGYDAVWVGPGVIAPGAEITLSGTRIIDKPGPFTYWVSNYYSDTYSTIGSVKRFNSLEVTPNFSVTGMTFSNTAPVQGENLNVTEFKITNNLPVPIDVDAVGVV